MADIGITMGENVEKKSVLINPNVKPSDRVVKIRDADGKVISAEVQQTNNIISEGANAKQAASKIYGRI